MTTSVWYTQAPWRGLRLMAAGAVIAVIGWALFWFEIAHAFGVVVFALGFVVVIWGQIIYIRALRQHRESPSVTSQPQAPRDTP